MQIRNSQDEYGVIAKAFHWVIAVLILGLLPVGLFMTGMPATPQKFEIYALHKSFGLTVFFLGLARIAWRVISPPPKGLPNHEPWERALAHAAHFWLYVCVIGMPLSGWLMSSAGEFPIPFFGIDMPALLPKNEGLADVFETVHSVLAYTLLGVLALHIAGALKHHVIDRDATLQRMGFLRGRLAMPLLVVAVAGLSYAACAVLLLKDDEPAAASGTTSADEADEAATPDAAGGWTLDKQESKLTFETTLYGNPLHGAFKVFGGRIVFDPANLAQASADITIDPASADTGDASRDDTMRGDAWFDVARNPVARFKAEDFTKTGDGRYEAKGTLSLRGKDVSVTLPFKFEESDGRASVKGEVTLDRLAFGIGEGEWASGETVGREVKISIDLVATR